MSQGKTTTDISVGTWLLNNAIFNRQDEEDDLMILKAIEEARKDLCVTRIDIDGFVAAGEGADLTKFMQVYHKKLEPFDPAKDH